MSQTFATRPISPIIRYQEVLCTLLRIISHALILVSLLICFSPLSLKACAAPTIIMGTPKTGSEDTVNSTTDISGFLTGAMTAKPGPNAGGTTTMYVSSALCGRHGLCVLLENVDQAGMKHFGMIDTGNTGSAVMKGFLKSHGVQSLEFLVLTHMHKDHIGNAVYLLKNYPVRALYVKQFDAKWSDGIQAEYEKILKAAASNSSTKKIVGVSCVLSTTASASPSASKGFVSWLKSHTAAQSRFKGLFTRSNVSFSLGSSLIQLFNWEIWSKDGISLWQPGRTLRCKASAFSRYNSDNNFSLGVRIAQGSRRLWVGGDMNNLRLERKTGSFSKGDEDRLRASIGRVDAMVMNHHGRGGSNTTAFLQTLSPSYAIYTSMRSEIENNTYRGSLASFRYLKNNLHLSEDRILWAGDYWKTHPEDPVITVSSTKLISSIKDGIDMEHWKGAAGANCAVIPLRLGHTYSTYDVTRDGKADFIQMMSTGTDSTHTSLTIRINQRTVYRISRAFSDAQPVSLILQPGHRAWICVSILSPKDRKSPILCLYRYSLFAGIPRLEKVYDLRSNLPDTGFTCKSTPVIKVSSGYISISCTGHDRLTRRIRSAAGNKSSEKQSEPYASVTFRLISDGTGLEPSSSAYPYTVGKNSSLFFDVETPLYRTAGSGESAGLLPAKSGIAFTHICKNNYGIVRYRIRTSDGNVWWVE